MKLCKCDNELELFFRLLFVNTQERGLLEGAKVAGMARGRQSGASGPNRL